MSEIREDANDSSAEDDLYEWVAPGGRLNAPWRAAHDLPERRNIPDLCDDVTRLVARKFPSEPRRTLHVAYDLLKGIAKLHRDDTESLLADTEQLLKSSNRKYDCTDSEDEEDNTTTSNASEKAQSATPNKLSVIADVHEDTSEDYILSPKKRRLEITPHNRSGDSSFVKRSPSKTEVRKNSLKGKPFSQYLRQMDDYRRRSPEKMRSNRTNSPIPSSSFILEEENRNYPISPILQPSSNKRIMDDILNFGFRVSRGATIPDLEEEEESETPTTSFNIKFSHRRRLPSRSSDDE